MIRRLIEKLPKKDIGDGKGNVFFWRHTVLKTPWFAVYLHRFERSDADRCLHDHPWPFISLILRGGYFEDMVDGRHWRRPGTVLVRRAEAAHRIELDPGRPKPWSLVVVGRKARAWGFYTLHGWQSWRPGFSPICETESMASTERGN